MIGGRIHLNLGLEVLGGRDVAEEMAGVGGLSGDSAFLRFTSILYESDGPTGMTFR